MIETWSKKISGYWVKQESMDKIPVVRWKYKTDEFQTLRTAQQNFDPNSKLQLLSCDKLLVKKPLQWVWWSTNEFQDTEAMTSARISALMKYNLHALPSTNISQPP